MTSLSSRVLCSKWLSPPKRFFGVFPKEFFTLVSQSPAVFWANGCCFRKGSVDGFANYSLHLSPKWLLRQKSSLEGSTNCGLHLSASLLLGSKLRESLTCPVRRKRPIMSLLLAYSLVFFFESHGQDMNWRCWHQKTWTHENHKSHKFCPRILQAGNWMWKVPRPSTFKQSS